MNTSKTVIAVENISLFIGKNKILHEISMEFEEGKIYGVIGRNGSGKTMLMKCICGFIPVTKGRIVVERQVVGRDVDFPKDIRFILETPGFIPYYSGYRNLKNLAKLNRKIGKEEIESALEVVGLKEKAKLSVRKYSLGMKQRLGLAQAIMENPKILILDEPMNGLDKEGVVQMREYLLRLKEKGTTILLASHSAEDIAVLCDDTYELEHGKIVARGIDSTR